MVSLVLTVIGDDRPGLVSAVSGPVEACGGSWQRSQLALLAGKFAGIVSVEVPAEQVAALESALTGLADQGLTVTVAPAVEEHAPAEGGTTWRMALVGQDRPGIVAEVSTALAARRVGIEDLDTDVSEAPMAGGLLFHASATLVAPDGADLAGLRADLERLADELMVDLDLSEE